MKNHIEYKAQDRIGYITLNRPEKRNALNGEIVTALGQAFSEAENDSSVKIIILRSTGDAFCAGADLSYLQRLQHFTYQENLADSNNLKTLFHQIYTLRKVVIAQVQGSAIAGGCGLAAVCDFVFASSEAKFGYTEVRIGFIPAIVMVFLLRKIAGAHARTLLLGGELISAEEARTIGLVNVVSNPSALEKEVGLFAEKLLINNAASAMMMTKKMIAEISSMSLDDALSYAASMNAEARATDDCKRGIEAFLNKEKILW
jgi:methylglutaconyl-CoA hydratase